MTIDMTTIDSYTTESLVENSTWDTSPPFSQVDITVAASLLIPFMVFGIVSNSLIIAVILTSPKLKNIFNYFIVSLCFSDLTSSLISWINLYRRTWAFNDFAIPNFFCWFYWGTDMWTSYVTAFHIASFAVLRFYVIWKPLASRKITLLHGKEVLSHFQYGVEQDIVIGMDQPLFQDGRLVPKIQNGFQRLRCIRNMASQCFIIFRASSHY